MDINPATLPQIQKGRRGRVVFIDDDALNVAKDLREIDASLRLAWNEFGEYFVVYQQLDDGTEHLVTTAQTADARLVKRIKRIAHPSYDYGKDLDEQDKKAEKAAEHIFEERVGDLAERLAQALRKDMSTPRVDINRNLGRSNGSNSKSTRD